SKGFKSKEEFEYPNIINVCVLRGACPCNCIHCPVGITPKQKRFQTFGNFSMNLKTFKKIVDETSEFNHSLLRIHSVGEPLLWNSFKEAINYAKSIKTWLFTCLVTEKKALLNLIAQNISIIEVSINSIDKIDYLKTKGIDNFDLVCRNIKYISELIKSEKLNTRLIVSRVGSEDEILDSKFVKYWKKSGLVADAFIRSYHNYNNMIENRKKSQIKREILPCLVHWARFNIDWNGDVVICFNEIFKAIHPDKSLILGNINEESIQDIWKGDKLNLIRKALLEKNYELIDSIKNIPCKNCNYCSPLFGKGLTSENQIKYIVKKTQLKINLEESVDLLRYVIRKEKNGAIFFDRQLGKVKFLSENQFEKYKDKKEYEIIYPEFYLLDCFSVPSKVYLELTRKCNLKCKTCYNKSRNKLTKELTKEEIFKIFNDLKNGGTFEIRITGGEPTLRYDFFDIVNYAHNLGFFVSVGTNGILSNKMLEKISKTPIDLIIISLDGPEKINDSIRGNGSFAKSINSLRYLSQKTDKQLRISMVIGKYNVNNIDFVVKLADELKIKELNLIPIRLNGRALKLPKQSFLTTKEYYDFVKRVELLRKSFDVRIRLYFDILGEKSKWLDNQTSVINTVTCSAGVESCVISPFGDMYGCPVSNPIDNDEFREIFITGNVRETSILKIWRDSSKWNVYRDLKLNKSKRCFKCNFYKNLCFGNCYIDSFFHSNKMNANDPYCFAHLLKNSGVNEGD
ncbi:MAG: radical SAM protein, partial [Promethearchaeota archaeon]